MKNRGVLLSLTIAGLFCWILMFLLNASSRDTGGISYLQSDLLLVWAGAALLGAAAGVLRRLGRMAGDPSYRRKLKAESDERYQAIRDRAGYLAGGLSLFLMLAQGMV